MYLTTCSKSTQPESLIITNKSDFQCLFSLIGSRYIDLYNMQTLFNTITLYTCMDFIDLTMYLQNDMSK